MQRREYTRCSGQVWLSLGLLSCLTSCQRIADVVFDFDSLSEAASFASGQGNTYVVLLRNSKGAITTLATTY